MKSGEDGELEIERKGEGGREERGKKEKGEGWQGKKTGQMGEVR